MPRQKCSSPGCGNEEYAAKLCKQCYNQQMAVKGRLARGLRYEND